MSADQTPDQPPPRRRTLRSMLGIGGAIFLVIVASNIAFGVVCFTVGITNVPRLEQPGFHPEIAGIVAALVTAAITGTLVFRRYRRTKDR